MLIATANNHSLDHSIGGLRSTHIDAYPIATVQEIHVAGHVEEADEKGRPLLIDTHDRPVDGTVWDLFAYAVQRIGPVPTVIEWDANMPDWPTLQAQADCADRIMETVKRAVAETNQPALAAAAACCS